MKQGLLLFAHGARDARWAAPFEDVAARLRAQAPETPVELAFLELMAPTLAEAGSRLVAAGCRAVDIVPLFLGAGGHVRRDVPALVGALEAAHPGVAWRLQPVIGEAEEVIAAMAAAARRLSAAAATPEGPA